MGLKEPYFTLLKSDVEAIDYKNGASDYYKPAAVDKLLASFSDRKLLNKVFQSLIPKFGNIGLCINLGGAGLFASVNADVFLSRYFSFELGVTIGVKDAYGGLKLHFPMLNQRGDFMSFYIWCLATGILFPVSEGLAGFYLPLGLHSTDKNGFIFSIEIAAIETQDGICGP